MKRIMALSIPVLVACGPSISSSADKALVPGNGTYAWGAPLANPMGAPEPNEASVRLQARIRSAMDSALAGKGYRKVDESHAGFTARYSVGVRTTTTDVPVQAPNNNPVPMTRCDAGGCWTGWDYGYGSNTDPNFAPETTRQAGVVLELVDRASGKVAWRGLYTDDVTGRSPTDERLQQAMSELIKSLPPAH